MTEEVRYRLWPGQHRWLSLLLDPEGPRAVLGSAGTGGGKTNVIGKAAICLAHYNPPGVPGIITEPTYRMVKDILRPTLEDLWMEAGIAYEWRATDLIYYLPETGTEILLRSADEPDKLRGLTVGWALQDEAAYQKAMAYKILRQRIRHPNTTRRAHGLATTPAGFNYLWDEFADPDRKDKNNAVVYWATKENLAVIEADPEFDASMRENFSAELYAQEAEGQFILIGQGRAYYEFIRTIHCQAFEEDPALPLDLCLDFNVNPAAWIVTQGAANRGIPERAIDEITTGGSGSTWKQIEEFQERYPRHRMGDSVRIYGDASGNARKTTGPSDFEAIKSKLPHAQFFVRNRNPRQKDRKNAVNTLFRKRKLYIHPTKCPRLLRDLERVVNQKDTFITDTSDQTLTHWSDALGYKIHWCYPVVAGARRAG